jgi:hypothetical protein
MPYQITNHAFLSEDARALEQPELEAHVRVAELVLGLAETAFTGKLAQRAADAVALQVTYQVGLDPQGIALSAWSQGDRSESFPQRLPDAHPWALRIVATLPITEPITAPGAAQYLTVRSFRPGAAG